MASLTNTIEQLIQISIREGIKQIAEEEGLMAAKRIKERTILLADKVAERIRVITAQHPSEQKIEVKIIIREDQPKSSF